MGSDSVARESMQNEVGEKRKRTISFARESLVTTREQAKTEFRDSL